MSYCPLLLPTHLFFRRSAAPITLAILILPLPLAALLSALVFSVGLLGLSSAPASAASGTVTEFSLPQDGTPFDITAGPDGNVWFTEEWASKIGRFSTS